MNTNSEDLAFLQNRAHFVDGLEVKAYDDEALAGYYFLTGEMWGLTLDQANAKIIEYIKTGTTPKPVEIMRGHSYVTPDAIKPIQFNGIQWNPYTGLFPEPADQYKPVIERKNRVLLAVVLACAALLPLLAIGVAIAIATIR